MKPRIYLDNSATTRVDEIVLESMLPCFRENFGNASSVHLFGQEAPTNAANYYTMGVKGRYLETRIEMSRALRCHVR